MSQLSEPAPARQWPSPALEAARARPTNPFVEFRPEDLEQSIPARFEQQVAQHPARLAVKTRDQTLTYGELNRLANRVAHAILARRERGDEPIALLLDRDAQVTVALLGALKAGMIYAPLDPSQPPARLAQLLESSAAPLIVTGNRLLPLAGALARDERRLLNLDDLGPDLPADNPALALPPDSPACILYTSGSTGQPKGVVHSHRNVLHLIRSYTNTIRLGAADRLSLLNARTAIGGLRDTFGALLNGAALFPYALREDGLASLAAWLTREEITVYNSAVALFVHFVGTLTGAERFPSIRLVKLGGERIYREHVELFKRHFSPNARLYLAVGATELGSFRHRLVARAAEVVGSSVSYREAIEGVEVMLLDEAGCPVGPDRVGEIVLKSRYLALGYWGRADLTRAAFRPDPGGGPARLYRTGDLGRIDPHGWLEVLGRKDFQVKIRGNRVEPAEVEQALLGQPGIKDAVVVAREHASGEHRLVAYVVPTDSRPLDTGALRRALGAELPAYLLPAVFVRLDSLPLASTGKVDRRALPAPSRGRPELERAYVAPRGPLEALLADLWAEVLDLERVGVEDEFLALGGDSLLAGRLVARIRDTLNAEVPLALLFKAPTVADQALALLQHRVEQAGDGELAHLLDQVEARPAE